MLIALKGKTKNRFSQFEASMLLAHILFRIEAMRPGEITRDIQMAYFTIGCCRLRVNAPFEIDEISNQMNAANKLTEK